MWKGSEIISVLHEVAVDQKVLYTYRLEHSRRFFVQLMELRPYSLGQINAKVLHQSFHYVFSSTTYSLWKIFK